jgi:translation initiation factor 3 subunit L
MSLRERVPPQYQNGEAARRAPDDDDDAEEETMANDYREQVQYDGMDDLDRMPSMTNNQDIHAQLQAAATPLEFQATLETKFASYDNYCNLFHYILNSEGPVDLEVPNVRQLARGRGAEHG